MYIDPMTTQNFNYATPIDSDNNPQNLKALDFDTDEHYVLRAQPDLRANAMLFEPKQVQSAVSPNFFTAWELEFIPMLN